MCSYKFVITCIDSIFLFQLPTLFPSLLRTRYDWNFTSEEYSLNNYNMSKPIKRPSMDLTSGCALGGSSSIGHFMYTRGCPGDYNTWAKITNNPIWEYLNILPYLKKSERLEDSSILNSPYGIFHGTKGFLGVTKQNSTRILRNYLESFREAGNPVILDSSGLDPFGYTLQLYTIAEGIRQSTAYLLQGKDKRPNLTVMTNTFVTKIILDENNNAIGVTALTRNGESLTILAKKEIVVTAGSFNTPKLLLLSGIGPRQHLESLNISVRSDLPVGWNLQDHLLLPLAFKMEKSNKPKPPINPHELPFSVFSGYVALNKSSACPEYQSINIAGTQNASDIVLLCESLGSSKEFCQKLSLEERNVLLTIITLLHPKSRGKVTLRSADPKDPPVIFLGTLTDERDMNDVLNSIEDYIRVLNTTYFKNVGAELINFNVSECADYEFATREYWKCYIPLTTGTIYHYLGTCSMGAVVDGEGRVYNIKKLRIADASIMPTQISANIMAAVMMIAEVIAERITQEYCDATTCP